MALTLNGSTGISGIAGSAGTPALQGNNDANTGYFFATDTLGLSTAGTERLKVTSAGLISIGDNTNLDSQLTITQSVGDCIRLRTSASNNTYKYGIIKLEPYNNNALGVQIVGAKSDSGYTEVDLGGGIDGGYAATQLDFWTAANTTTATGTRRLRIDSSGRLLVGTTDAGHANGDELTLASSGNAGLTIRSGTSDSGNIYFADGTSGDDLIRGFISYGHNVNGMYFATNTSTRMFIDSVGKVGIGTTSPSELLHVNGTASIGYLNVSQGGLTAGQKVTIAGSGNASGDDLTINNWGNADGDYWVIGTNITSNASGSTSKTNDTNRSACLFLDGRIGRMILNTSESGTSTTTDTHSWTRDGNYTLTGNVVVANGKGIDFSATNNASGTGISSTSELFDTYEEGTWTPVPSRYTGGAITTNGAINVVGNYTRVGRLVTVEFSVEITGTITQGSSLNYLDGLPYLCLASYRSSGSLSRNTALNVNYTNTCNVHNDFGGVIYFSQATQTTAILNVDWVAGFVNGSITYITSAST